VAAPGVALLVAVAEGHGGHLLLLPGQHHEEEHAQGGGSSLLLHLRLLPNQCLR
jgi:hypothetical protein